MTDDRLKEVDKGKRVVDAQGNKIGMISGFRDGQAYVDPDPSTTDSIRSKLNWDSVSSDDKPLDHSKVVEVTDDEVRIST